MKKNILLAGLLCAAAAGFVAYNMYNKEHKDLNETKADINISSEALLTAFSDNEDQANATYLNKVISVQGNLLEIKDVEGTNQLILNAGNPMGTIMCEMDKRFYPSNPLPSVGSQITVKGLCSGYLSDVILNQSVIIK